MKINIKQATSPNIKELSVLFNEYRVFYQQESNLTLAETFLKSRITNQESVIFIAQSESNMLGFTQLFPSFSSVSAQATWILNDLYVLPEHRNLGIGSQLLKQAKTYAEQTHAKGIFLQTADTNIGAQKLYQSHGYQHQEFKGYFLAV